MLAQAGLISEGSGGRTSSRREAMAIITTAFINIKIVDIIKLAIYHLECRKGELQFTEIWKIGN
jgi:hypothetical protein